VTAVRIVPLAAVLAGLAAAATAAAARPSLSLTPSVARPGQLVVVHGNADGCPAGDTVFVLSKAFAPKHEFAGVPAVLARVRRGGVFQVTTRIPATRRPSTYVVTGRCGGGNLGILRRLVVR